MQFYKNKIFLSLIITFISLISLYFLLGQSHPYIVFLTSILIVAKIKTVTVLGIVFSKIYLFLAMSKGKIFAFLSKMTLFKGISLAVKRFIIDNVVSKWINKHIISHLKKPISDFFSYYKRLNWKTKIKKSILVVVPAGLISVWLYFSGYIQSLALYAQLKGLVIAFFKILWIVASKVIGYITYVFTNFIAGTWLAPIVEIFALSWLLSLIEKIPLVGPYIKKFFDFIGKGIGHIFKEITFYFNKFFGNWISMHVGKYGEQFGKFLDRKVNITKAKNELFVFDGFRKKYLELDVQKYFEGKYSEESKKDFYNEVNLKTNDHIDIKAFFELEKHFHPVEDFLILEGVASDNIYGTNHEEVEIQKESFWVLNLNKKSFFVLSKHNLFEPVFVSYNSLKLIHPRLETFSFEDIYLLDLENNKYENIEII